METKLGMWMCPNCHTRSPIVSYVGPELHFPIAWFLHSFQTTY